MTVFSGNPVPAGDGLPQSPDWLAAAHARLDAAVFAAYNWPGDLSDEEMLARLLALNGARAGA